MYLPKRSVFEGLYLFLFSCFCAFFWGNHALLYGNHVAFMAGNESEAIKKSGIRGETKLFFGENGSYLERNPHFSVDFFPTHSPFFPLSIFGTEMISR